MTSAWEREVVVFYFANCETDNVEQLCADKFGIDEEALNYILACDLHASFQDNYEELSKLWKGE